MIALSPSLLRCLAKLDTPTVCNVIELTLHGNRDFHFTRQPVVATTERLPAFFGFAKTAIIQGSQPHPKGKAAAQELSRLYYRYMSTGPRPAVTVIEDLDDQECSGAFWGEVNSTVHKGFRISGVLTNGLVRDLDCLADNFPILAGGIGPSHHHVHVQEIDCPVNVLGLPVKPGDLIHADHHGAVVIPDEAISNFEVALTTMLESEAYIIEAARKPGFTVDAYEHAKSKFDKRRL